MVFASAGLLSLPVLTSGRHVARPDHLRTHWRSSINIQDRLLQAANPR
jgi:hypothetical protein